MGEAPSRKELEAAYCWEGEDHVPGRPDVTAFRRATRLHQARWREAKGHPMGSQPIKPPADGRAARPAGSRLAFDYAVETGANFLTPAAFAAAKARAAMVERHQSFDHQRLWADLLWSPTLAFNLFGDLAADLARADRAVHTWWPDTPGTVVEVRFAHSPGRLDPSFLNSLRSFDVAFVLDLDDETRGIVAVDIKYHERMKPEIPKPRNLSRNREVALRSGIFKPRALDLAATRSGLAVMWLEHLLLLSMLQHASGQWTWGRYVVVHPAANGAVVDACARYRDLLADRSTFAAITIENLLAAPALPKRTVAFVRERYIVGLTRSAANSVAVAQVADKDGVVTQPSHRADMFMDLGTDPREGGTSLGDERETLVEFLRCQRLTLQLKCEGLNAEQLARRAVEPSTMSLLGLLRHMAEVERGWFRRRFVSQDVPKRYQSDEEPDGDFDGAVADQKVVDEAWAAWREEVAFAEQFARDTELGFVGQDGAGHPISLRELMVHMIEEYARHNGHADLLRERLDGRLGQ